MEAAACGAKAKDVHKQSTQYVSFTHVVRQTSLLIIEMEECVSEWDCAEHILLL